MRQEEYRKADVIKKKLDKESKGEDEVDVEDIKRIAETSELGGKSMDIIKLEFERTPETDTEKGRRWRHKRTGRSFL